MHALAQTEFILSYLKLGPVGPSTKLYLKNGSKCGDSTSFANHWAASHEAPASAGPVGFEPTVSELLLFSFGG